MKIILSRKGFDSEYGGMPSPILPDGTLLSMPIPNKKKEEQCDEEYWHDKCNYKELSIDIWNDKKSHFINKTYADILKELDATPNKGFDSNYNKDGGWCHLDPDIRKGVLRNFEGNSLNHEWEPAFGQSEGAESHLRKQGIHSEKFEEDIFLFFGWFRQTEFTDDEKLRFKDNEDLQVIYAYMQIGDILDENEYSTINARCPWHPHNNEKKYSKNGKKKKNAIYFASDKLMINGEQFEKYKGYGNFKLKKDVLKNIHSCPLVLTKIRETRTRWDYDKLSGVEYEHMTHHSTKNKLADYFQSANIGQEFVLNRKNGKDRGNVNQGTIEWLKKLFKNEYVEIE